MKSVQIGDYQVGPGHPTFVTAEIGINHNGSLDIAHKLIEAASSAGCQAVKFQKRTVDVVYSQAELDKPRQSPWGTTNREQKEGLEFSLEDYHWINYACKRESMLWFASCWDCASVDFIAQFNPPAWKISSASLTDDSLLKYHRAVSEAPVILSTGMSTLKEIDRAVDVLGTERLIILHCTSTYPCAANELNLACIPALKERYGVPIGFSDHFPGLPSSVAAVALGACMVEKHITLNRTMYGSDQAASVEPEGLRRLVREIRFVETALGDGNKRVYESEMPVRAKLRRV